MNTSSAALRVLPVVYVNTTNSWPQVNKHSEKQIMNGLLPQRLLDRAVDSMNDHETLSMEVLENPDVRDGFARLILQMLSRDSL